jgi:AP-1-like transcription factor
MDINDLCAEFTASARCDGTKVVLEPQGVNHILEKFSRSSHTTQDRNRTLLEIDSSRQ